MCCPSTNLLVSDQEALETATVTPSTVTAVINGLTIRLTGFATEPITVSAPDAVAAGDTLTIHGVTYTIDRSAVDMRRAEITFVFADSSAQTSVYGAGDIGTAFRPTASADTRLTGGKSVIKRTQR